MRRGRMILIPLIILTLLSFSAGVGFLVTHPGALNRLGLNIRSAFSPPPLCGDGNCEGKDPYQTQCNTAAAVPGPAAASVANEVGVYDQFGHKLLVVQNWYSPKCKTNWALAYIMQFPVHMLIDIVGNDSIYCINGRSDCSLQALSNHQAQPFYTAMIVAPNSVACAYGESTSPFDPHNGNSPDPSYKDMACA